MVISSVISGYFFSIGADLWAVTKEQTSPLPFGNLFWFVSVPIGIVGIVLLAYAIWYSKHKPKPLLYVGAKLKEGDYTISRSKDEALSSSEPELTIAPTELKEYEKIKEIQLVLRDGRVIRHEARFYYVTVTNTWERSVRISARFRSSQHMIFVPLNKKPMFRVVSKYDTEGFKRQVETFGDEEAIVIALNTDERWESRFDVTIHPGPAGEAFVLFFTLKDFRVMTVPGGTRIYPNHNEGFPCRLPLSVCLDGDETLPHYYVARFEVVAKNWKDFKVKQIGKTVKGP